jgi:hypothetical protein
MNILVWKTRIWRRRLLEDTTVNKFYDVFAQPLDLSLYLFLIFLEVNVNSAFIFWLFCSFVHAWCNMEIIKQNNHYSLFVFLMVLINSCLPKNWLLEWSVFLGCLNPKKFIEFKLVKKTQLSPNTAKFRFALPTASSVLGLPVGQHVLCRFK